MMFLKPGDIVVTKKDRFAKLYDGSYKDPKVPTWRLINARTRCLITFVTNTSYQERYYVLAEGTFGWLSRFDIAHMEE